MKDAYASETALVGVRLARQIVYRDSDPAELIRTLRHADAPAFNAANVGKMQDVQGIGDSGYMVDVFLRVSPRGYARPFGAGPARLLRGLLDGANCVLRSAVG